MSVPDPAPTFLSVTETAQRLGVHPNTVRNWVRDGVLPTARIPGSRFHRFDARDVERLRRQRGATVASVEQERRAIGPELIDATQLSQWATTRDAQAIFPQLIRRLLASTPGISNLSMRSGDGVSAPGWDGRANSDGTARYLPGGILCFELGVGANPKPKAQADYDKRTADPRGEVASDACFVFITPRRWATAAEWEHERRGDGVWAGVRVLDADDIEGWLHATPAVHYWISEQLGRRPQAAVTLERWWQRFEARTDPPLPLALFRAGRENECDQLMKFLTGTPGVIGVQASWRDEATAFVHAAIERDREQGGQSVQPPLIVSESDVWERVVAQPGGMTLLPTFDDPDLASARAAGHHVVIPFGREHVARHTTIVLPRPHRQAAAEAMEAAKFDADRAYQLAALARRNMAALVRRLARDPRHARPRWSSQPAAAILAPLTLIGAWTESEVDLDVVARMAASEWRTIERELTYWRKTEDPPFVRPGGQWHLASAEEAFMVLRDALSPEDLERWTHIAVEVLLENDPKLELPTDDRPMAGLIGATRAHSSSLRRGIAEGIALVGALGSDVLSDGVSGADHASRIVRRLLEAAEVDNSGRTWQSLADELPRLAEAAPDAFLDGVHDALDRDPSLLATMFQDREQGSWLYSASPHTGLLWALETLCWSPDYLVPATRALARLDSIDPGGRLSNRPLESMQSVLVPWIRHTGAPLDARKRAVVQVCRHLPDVGWKLVLALWPTSHGVASPPSTPRFRDWKPDKRTVTVAEWADFVGQLVSLAIETAEADPGKWEELVGRLGPLPPAERKRLLDRLDDVANSETLTADQRLRLWERLRDEVARHRGHPDADWSMEPEPLVIMNHIAERLEPADKVERYAYLFDWRPDLSQAPLDDREAYNAALVELRHDAVVETLEAASIDGLARLAQRSAVPRHLGWTVAEVAGDDLASELLNWLDAEDNRRDVAGSWAMRRADAEGVPWLAEMLGRSDASGSVRQLALALNAPATREVWDLLADAGDELHTAYWTHMNPWRVSASDAEHATKQLLAHGRPWVAVDLLASQVHQEPEGSAVVTAALVQEVLDAALKADPAQSTSQSVGYEVGLLLDHLESRRADTALIIRYEWAFFRLLDDYREPRALFAALGQDPSFFVELVSRVYRGKQQQRRQLSEEDSALAHHSWWVLNHWHRLPGHRDDGTVDSDQLKAWVREARLMFADNDRADIGDEQIGQVLSASPPGADGVWPAEPVRDIIETIGSRSLETGIHVGIVNARGVTSRGPYDGGQQERVLAADYRRWAGETAVDWPRTSRVLRGIAGDYDRDARREDARAELSADTE